MAGDGRQRGRAEHGRRRGGHERVAPAIRIASLGARRLPGQWLGRQHWQRSIQRPLRPREAAAAAISLAVPLGPIAELGRPFYAADLRGRQNPVR